MPRNSLGQCIRCTASRGRVHRPQDAYHPFSAEKKHTHNKITVSVCCWKERAPALFRRANTSRSAAFARRDVRLPMIFANAISFT